MGLFIYWFHCCLCQTQNNDRRKAVVFPCLFGWNAEIQRQTQINDFKIVRYKVFEAFEVFSLEKIIVLFFDNVLFLFSVLSPRKPIFTTCSGSHVQLAEYTRKISRWKWFELAQLCQIPYAKNKWRIHFETFSYFFCLSPNVCVS